ncbi:MAG TPA: copper transporter, partial [Acidimicrobiales bacterium]|nr:copper transporter [Acidimicrobiales bacterium]
MINLRYHIVSLVAVFLALGLGIVMGTTVIDRVTVDALNDRLDTVQRSQGAVREENGRLKAQVDQGQ